MFVLNNIYLSLLVFINLFCNAPAPSENINQTQKEQNITEGLSITTGAEQIDQYLPFLRGKRIGLLVNTTSMVGDQHLVDVLRSKKVNIQAIFAPEHGFRGEADAGEDVKNAIDPATGIPIISIYGAKKGPTKEDLANIDLVIFDVQDVGARFYTYLSTLKYLMEACALYKKPLLVLDRPNPNGHYIDGPILEMSQVSFIGIIPIPVVHGMTLGELAQLMNGEKYLKDSLQCNLKVIACKNYDHQKSYIVPVKPSPNLPNQTSILLYPSLCLFEGTNFSVGRGTDKQFQIYGSPVAVAGDYYFTPVSKPGATAPFLQGKKCRGFDLSTMSNDKIKAESRINLSYLLDAYRAYPDKDNFFLKNNFIDLLMGTHKFQEQVKKGLSETDIRASWQAGLDKFKNIRKKYLLYPN